MTESKAALRRESVEQLTTGEISHRAEDIPDLPPSVAKEGGQEHYRGLVKNYLSA